MTKHKPEINSRAADEIALAGGHVEEPVGFQDEMHPGRQGVFGADEGGEGHEGVFSVGGGAVVEGEVPGGVLKDCHVLHSASADGETGEREPAVEGKNPINEQATPAGVFITAVLPIAEVGGIAFRAYAEVLAEMNLERSAYAEGQSAYFRCHGNTAIRGRECHVSCGDIAAVDHHASGIAGKRRR